MTARSAAKAADGSIPRRAFVALSAWSCLSLMVGTTAAQQPPALGYVFPPAVRAGTSVDVHVGGYDLTPDSQVLVHDERVRIELTGPLSPFLITPPPYWFGPKSRSDALPIPREFPARVEIPADVLPGLLRWQVANANGSSTTAVLYVSDRKEVVEDRDRDRPQRLPLLPVAVSGRLSRIAEVDRYRFTSPVDGPVTVELFARRLGADFHGQLQVHDDTGRIVADVADTQGRDAALTFAARKERTYTVALHDVDFRGHRGMVYRLTLDAAPRVVCAIPSFGRRGESTEFELIGFGVRTGEARLESVKRRIDLPSDTDRRCIEYRLDTPFGSSPPIELGLSDVPERVAASQGEDEPLDLSAPSAVTGNLGAERSHKYRWRAAAGESWRLRVRCRSIGTTLDPSLSIHDADGKVLAENDDLPGTTDAGLDFTAPADGMYTLRIDAPSSSATDLASVYRLSVERPEPSFSLSADQQWNAPIGSESTFVVRAIRAGGFGDPIDLRIRGLGDDVKVPDELRIPADAAEWKLSLRVAEDAGAEARLISITGKSAGQGTAPIERPVLAPATGDLFPNDPERETTERILLTTTLKPPFALKLVDKNRQRVVHAGTTYPAEFQVEREDGFHGRVFLLMAARQGRHRQGITAPIVPVPDGQGDCLFPCFMPEWLESDRTTRMAVLGMAEVMDARGRTRYVTSTADARVTMIMEGALLKIEHHAKEITAGPGESFRIPFTVSRSAKLRSDVTVELVAAESLVGSIDARAVRLGAEQSRGVLSVTTSADKPLDGDYRLSLQATALLDEQWPVVSRAEVTVRFR